MAHLLTLRGTGETGELLTDGVATGGARVEFLTSLPARVPGPPLHVHPLQDELFDCIEGRLLLIAGDARIELEPGERHSVRAGTPHRFENPGPGIARWRVTMEPALHFDYLAEAMIGLVNAAHPDAPRPEDVAFVLSQAPGEYYLADTPAAEQDAERARLAPMARRDSAGVPLSLDQYSAARPQRAAMMQGGY